MASTVYFADALPGTGKTEAVIQSLAKSSASRTLIAVPTIKLAESIEKRIITSIPGFTDIRRIDSVRYRRQSSVANITAKALRAKEEKVLIITHAALETLIEDPELLNGWRLVIDEVPGVLDNQRFPVGFREFAMLFGDILEGHPFDRENGPSKDNKVTVRDDAWWEAMDLMSGWKRRPYGNRDNYSLLKAAMDDSGELYIKEGSAASDMSGQLDVRVARFINWASLFDAASEVHILGHAVKRTVMALYLESHGYTLLPSPEFTPSGDRKTYLGECIIYPLTNICTNAKGRLMIDWQGSPVKEVTEETVAYAVAKAASDKIRELNLSDGGIFQCYGWFDDETVAGLENLKNTGYSVEGLNCYRGMSASVSIIHGNERPEDNWTIERTFKLMEVDVEEGLECLRHDKQFEAQFQHATRTAVRRFDEATVTYHFVTTMEEAKMMAEKFAMGDQCRIDTSLMMDVPGPKPQDESPKRKAERQAKREGKKAQKAEAQQLLAEGWTQKDAAEAVGVSVRTLRNWFKEAA